jgi:hypothetical protein
MGIYFNVQKYFIFKMKSEILINYSIDMCWSCPCTRVMCLTVTWANQGRSYFIMSPLREHSYSMLLSTVNMCMLQIPNTNLSCRCHHLLLMLKSWKLNTTLGCLENFSFIGSLHSGVRFEHKILPMCEWHPDYYVCICWIGMFHGNARV